MKHREDLKKELVKGRTTELRMAKKQLQLKMTASKRAEPAVQEAREYAESIVETGNWESKLYSVAILSHFASGSHPEGHSPALFQQHHVSV